MAERFWPGPLTLVLTKSADVPGLLTAGAATIAVRMPDHPVPRAIAAALGSPITGTSANVSGRPDPESLEEVKNQLGVPPRFHRRLRPVSGGNGVHHSGHNQRSAQAAADGSHQPGKHPRRHGISMAGRPNWYSEHPPACTCAECSQSRLSHRSRVRLPKIGCLGVLLGVLLTIASLTIVAGVLA